jgi:hypothetical protein
VIIVGIVLPTQPPDTIIARSMGTENHFIVGKEKVNFDEIISWLIDEHVVFST